VAEAAGAQRFVGLLMGAVANCSLYSPEHPAVLDLSHRAAEEFAEAFGAAGSVEILLVDSDLVVNRSPLRDPGIHGRSLIKRLRRRGLSRVDVLAGVTEREIRDFAAALAGAGPLPAGQSHIRTGTIDVQLRAAGGGASLAAEPGVDAERLARLREILRPQALFQQLDTVGLEEIVVSFVETIRREERLLRLISPVKAYSEYTYTHASNVTVLSLLQAESLGIAGETLHEIGMAALLHDVGKLHVAKEILDKSGKLDDREWSEIRKHPLYGAWYLSRIEGLTRLAPIVAVEHHLRYDGQGYPRLEAYRRGQHLSSQIVSIADFFDALRSKRPYKKDWEIAEILALLRKGAGTEFNPMLVDNFSRILVLALKEG
jgi:hypothetical protein